MKNTLLTIGLITTLGAIGGLFYFNEPVEAYTDLGTITTASEEVRIKVEMNAKIIEINGGQVTLEDTDTGVTYKTAIGPAWFLDKDYAANDTVKLTGLLVDAGDNDKGHTLSILTFDGQTLRGETGGKPMWAGKGGRNGNGMGTGTGDGTCLAE